MEDRSNVNQLNSSKHYAALSINILLQNESKNLKIITIKENKKLITKKDESLMLLLNKIEISCVEFNLKEKKRKQTNKKISLINIIECVLIFYIEIQRKFKKRPIITT